jgi:hypothetical protein
MYAEKIVKKAKKVATNGKKVRNKHVIKMRKCKKTGKRWGKNYGKKCEKCDKF